MDDQPTTNDPSNEQGGFYRQLGASVVFWNEAEEAIRELLLSVGRGTLVRGSDMKTEIFVAEMGSRQVSEALRTFAHDVLDDGPATLVNHAAAYFDRLLVYRNYYIHGIKTVLGPPVVQGQEFGMITGFAAKGKLTLDGEELQISKLEQFCRWAQTLSSFANQTRFHFFFDPPGRVASPEMPPLPDSLAKPRRTWRSLTRPPQSSEA